MVLDRSLNGLRGSWEGLRANWEGFEFNWDLEKPWSQLEQLQKRYMVSSSLCPLISFLDVSYSVSFVVMGLQSCRGR